MESGTVGSGTIGAGTVGAGTIGPGAPKGPPSAVSERQASPPRLTHVGALDGIRALAVLAVMAFHAGLSWASGGFLGVDAFFVLSGYLITALLLVEFSRTGTIRLPAFWARRARRLLPAALLLLVGVAVYAKVLTPRGDLGRIRGDALATLGYVANWRFIFEKAGYFDTLAPTSPLRHMWSLAVEEQFYLLWPLIASLAFWWLRSKAVLFAIAITGVVASVMTTVLLYAPGDGVSRVYYGTDAKAHVILIGACLALLGPGASWAATRRRRTAALVAGAAGVAFSAWAWTHMDGEGSFYYEGGSLLAALAVAGVIAGVVSAPTAGVARVLSVRPLQAIGRISYGLYLWHWPTFLVVNRAHTGLTGPALLAARFAVTFALAFLSYRLVEQPIRRGRVPAVPLRVATPLAIGAVVLVLVLATVRPPPSASAAIVTKAFALGPEGRAHPDPARVRVLMLGDSVAWTLVFGLTARQAEHNVYVANDVALGCGITRFAAGTRVMFRGRPLQPRFCTDAPAGWFQTVDEVQPDIVTLLVGHQDVADRTIGGRFRHLGDPVFDAFTRAELDRVLATITARGVDVVVLTSPYFRGEERPDGDLWSEDDPARVDRFNRILREAVARRPGRVTLFDLNRLVSPGGRYVRTIDGVEVRAADGIHFHPEGAGWLAAPLLRHLEAQGDAHRDARLSSSLTSPPTPTP